MENQKLIQDSSGRMITECSLKPLERLKEQFVESMLTKVAQINELLRASKIEINEEIEAYLKLTSEEYGVKYRTRRGNYSITNLSGTKKINVVVADNIVFDERLSLAKQQIDDCIVSWADSNTSSNLRKIVDHAFQIDKTGNVSKDRILGLRRVDINDTEWLKAMNLIADSIKVVGSKSYVRFYKKDDIDSDFTQISLDFASV